MMAPSFFKCDTRRTDFAWTDWDAVHAFLADQVVCRVAVHDGTWPYVVAQTYHYVDGAFVMHFSRSGKLASCMRADPHVTIEVDQAVSFPKMPHPVNANAEYRSVIARCLAEISELVLDAEGRRIYAVRARIQTLSAKQRILSEAGVRP